MEFLKVGWSGAGFRLSRKPFSSDKKCELLKTIFNYDIIVQLSTPLSTHPGVEINRAKFHVCTPRSFEKVKARARARTHTHTKS